MRRECRSSPCRFAEFRKQPSPRHRLVPGRQIAKQPPAVQYGVFSQRMKELVRRRQQNIRPAKITIEVADPGLYLLLQSSEPVGAFLSFRNASSVTSPSVFRAGSAASRIRSIISMPEDSSWNNPRSVSKGMAVV